MCDCVTENDFRSILSNNNDDWLKFPYEITDVSPELNRKILGDFTGERTGFVQVGPEKWFFPSGYKKNAEIYYNFQPRPDDVWIVTFPRSGTTFSQELIWLLENNLDYEKAAQIPLEMRFPFLEFSSFVHPEVKQEFLEENKYSDEKYSSVETITKPAWMWLTETSEKRFIKTHLPFQLLSPNLLNSGCKVIYVARNPKDVAVSFYHLNRLFRTQGFQKDFPTYWYYFENNLQPWTPYWSHVKEGWKKRHEENLLFLFYEDMNKDLPGAIRKIMKFLDKSYNDEQIASLERHLNIENFRNNKSVNFSFLQELGVTLKSEEGFVRKGRSGGWQEYFVGDLRERVDHWVESNLRTTDLRFPGRFL